MCHYSYQIDPTKMNCTMFFQFLKRFVMSAIGDSGGVAFLSHKTAPSSAVAERMGFPGVRPYVRRNERFLFAARMKD